MHYQIRLRLCFLSLHGPCTSTAVEGPPNDVVSEFFPSRSSRMHQRQRKLLNSESLRNGPSPTLTRHSLGSRSRNFHVICSPRTCPHYHWHLSPHCDTIVHSLYLRCATRMRTRTDCQGSVRMTQNKVSQCGPTPKISMLRAWKGKIGIQL